MSRLNGKVALVTGAARGIGAAAAQAMVDEGAKVIIGDVLDEEGKLLADKIGPSATYVHLDVTDRADWDAAVVTATNAYGRLDVLVNNAGISIPGPIDVHEQAAWDKVIAVNLTGVFKGIQASVPALKSSGRGSIINVSSIAGLLAVPGSPGYVATKFGVRGLTKAAAMDLGKYGIRVNSVHPGFINTPLTAGIPVDAHDLALGRGGEPDEVAKLIVFLASDESSFSTGAEFTADGGETAGSVSGGSLSAVVSGPPGDDQAPDSQQIAENKALVVDFYDQLFNRGNLAVIDDVVRPDLIQHNPQLPGGSQALRDAVAGIKAAFPDASVTIERVIAQGDLVLVHSHHVREPGSSGSAVFDLFRLDNGKLAEHWAVTQDVPDRTASGNDMFSTLSAPRLPWPDPRVDHADNVSVAKASFDAITADRDLTAFDRYYGDPYHQHSPQISDGAAGAKEFFARAFTGDAYFNATIKRVIAEGDYVAIHAHYKFAENDPGMAAMDLYRIREGKIVEHWDVVQPIPTTPADENTMF